MARSHDHVHDHHDHAHSHAGSDGLPVSEARRHAHDGSHGHAHGGAHGHSHGPGLHVHGATTDKRRVLLAGLLTGGFMIVEALGGLLTGSLALLADAGHMLTDTVALWLAWYAFHLAERPATARHTYGLGRFKTLVAYTNGLAIFAIAVWICYEAIERFRNPPEVLGGWMLIIACAGFLTNVAGFWILNGGSRESLNMRGAILHVLGDLLGSVAAIVAALVIIGTGWMPIDPILSIAVALMILVAAWKLMRDAVHLLLEGTPANLDRDTIAKDLTAHVQGVREIHHMHLWSLDGEKTMATLHACLKPDADSDRTVAAIKRRLSTQHGVDHVTVEPEFGRCADLEPAHLH